MNVVPVSVKPNASDSNHQAADGSAKALQSSTSTAALLKGQPSSDDDQGRGNRKRQDTDPNDVAAPCCTVL